MDYKELTPLVVKAFQQGLDKSKSKFGKPVNTTFKLRNSIKGTPISDGLIISFNEYGKFINEGTRRSKYAGETKGGGGRSEMIESLLVWIDKKGIRPRFGTKLGLALAIRNSIWNNGITANHWLDNVVDTMLDENGEIYKYLESMAVEDIEEQIVGIIESIEGI